MDRNVDNGSQSARERFRAAEVEGRERDQEAWAQPPSGAPEPSGRSGPEPAQRWPAEQRRPEGGRGWGAAAGAAALGGLLLLKFAGKLKFLFVGLKFLKLGTLVKTGGTMLLMIWSYALFYGWPFAAGFVLLLLVHELGHGTAARLVGLRAGAPVFIPFVGAFIALKDRPRSSWQDMLIGAGGPFAGTTGGLACIVLAPLVGGWTGGLLRAVGYVTLIINFFNLFPVWQLDGARMTRPLKLAHWLTVLVVLGLVTVWTAGHSHDLNPMVLIVLLVVGWRTVKAWLVARRTHPQSALERLAEAGAPQPPDEAEVTPGQRGIAAAAYLGLAALLIVTIHVVYDSLAQGKP